MKPIKQHITFVLALLMAYAPIHNIMHYVWVDHDHHHHHHANTIDDEVTAYELHHNCSDFLYQLTSLTSIIVLSIDDIAGLIYSKTLGNDTAIVIGRHLLINALRGPPSP
ncbi:MAG: hypothetical protein H6584_02745 [Flavobacteriales bacterium]|nr:hypothetical protein [Flavobacteriales bacterium]